jgi:GT2 family glycosyltransferase
MIPAVQHEIESTQTSLLSVSVVVPTRNRPEHAAACAKALAAVEGSREIIFVDQSDDHATKEALSMIAHRRLRYVRTETRGVTQGRNLGMQLSTGEIIAFTDDDCRVSADWVSRIAAVFAADVSVAVVCGRVHVPPEVYERGWAEGFEPRTREWQGRFPPIGQWGITANLALRRSVLQAVGPFDPLLGAGTFLRSGGEPDFLFRVLEAGFKVVNAEEVSVDHLGVRQRGSEINNLLTGYGIGTAAAFMKHIRLGDSAAAMVYLRFLFKTLNGVFRRILSFERPIGGRFLMAFIIGTFSSYRFRVDRQRRQYVVR